MINIYFKGDTMGNKLIQDSWSKIHECSWRELISAWFCNNLWIYSTKHTIGYKPVAVPLSEDCRFGTGMYMYVGVGENKCSWYGMSLFLTFQNMWYMHGLYKSYFDTIVGWFILFIVYWVVVVDCNSQRVLVCQAIHCLGRMISADTLHEYRPW